RKDRDVLGGRAGLDREQPFSGELELAGWLVALALLRRASRCQYTRGGNLPGDRIVEPDCRELPGARERRYALPGLLGRHGGAEQDVTRTTCVEQTERGFHCAAGPGLRGRGSVEEAGSLGIGQLGARGHARGVLGPGGIGGVV